MMKPTPAALQHEPRMRLAAVTKGKVVRPLRVLLYGVEGVGKSTFAASAPNPIFIGAEDGTSELDVARFPQPQSWRDMFEALEELTRGQHDYKTVAVDTLDWLEPLCWAALVERARKPTITSIEDFGYGKGYTAAVDEWRLLLGAFERLRAQRGMHVIFLAHSWIKTFKNPEDEDYDRYEMKLNAKAGGLLREWCDTVLFARYETFTTKDDRTKRVRGVSNGARVMHTQRMAAWDAKNRHDLPETLPLDWHAFEEAVRAHRPADPSALRSRIAELLVQADEALCLLVNETVAKAGEDAAQLARIADRLAAKINLQTQGNAP